MKEQDILSENQPGNILSEPALEFGKNAFKDFGYINKARRGLTKRNLLSLKKNTHLDLETLANLLDINPRTIQRRGDDEPFKTSTSEKMLAIANLYTYGFEIFESNQNFIKWMNSPISALNNEMPISFLDTFYGINEVKNLIGRIAYGVYS